MNRVALVTCRVLPEPDPDQELLLDALRRTGLDAELLAWDDPSGDPGRFDLCVLRSCWDYYRDPNAFLAWIDKAAERSRLLNPPEVVRWNHHKGYLRALENAGVPVIPTAHFSAGTSPDLTAVMDGRGWDDVVVKPAISASSYRTGRFTADRAEGGNGFLADLLRERDAMVQRYMPAVEGEGEQAIVWIAGEFTHAVRKSPRFAGGVERVSDALPVPEDARALAERTLGQVRGELLYARVDMVRNGEGNFLVSELELIEPSLFLVQKPEALRRFVGAVKDRLA